MSQGLQAECQTGKYYMQLMQENYELKCRNKYLQGQLEKGQGVNGVIPEADQT